MSLIKWKPRGNYNPFDEFFNMDQPNFGLSLFPVFDQGLKNNLIPAIDVSEKDGVVNIKADIPGIKKEDISLSVDGTILTIRGERKSEVDKKEKNYHRIERSYGTFQRSLDLGTYIDENKVNAKYNDGVLEIEVPKVEKEKTKTIEIK